MATRSVPSVSASPGRLSIVEIEVPARDTTFVSASGILSVVSGNDDPTISDQNAPFGALTLASAGGWKPVDSSGDEVDLVSVDDQTGATRTWSISSGRLIANGTPGVDDTVELLLTTALGQFTATIDAEADTYSFKDATELAAIIALGVGTVSGKTFKGRKGDYTWTDSTLDSRSFTSETTVTSHDLNNRVRWIIGSKQLVAATNLTLTGMDFDAPFTVGVSDASASGNGLNIKGTCNGLKITNNRFTGNLVANVSAGNKLDTCAWRSGLAFGTTPLVGANGLYIEDNTFDGFARRIINAIPGPSVGSSAPVRINRNEVINWGEDGFYVSGNQTDLEINDNIIWKPYFTASNIYDVASVDTALNRMTLTEVHNFGAPAATVVINVLPATTSVPGGLTAMTDYACTIIDTTTIEFPVDITSSGSGVVIWEEPSHGDMIQFAVPVDSFCIGEVRRNILAMIRDDDLVFVDESQGIFAEDNNGGSHPDTTHYNLVIEGNLIYADTTHGISVYNAYNTHIIGNTIVAPPDSAVTRLGPILIGDHWTGTRAGNVIRDNIAKAFTVTSPSSGGSITNNVIAYPDAVDIGGSEKYTDVFVNPGYPTSIAELISMYTIKSSGPADVLSPKAGAYYSNFTNNTSTHPSEPADIAGPILSAASGTQTGATTADLAATTDTSNGTVYWVVSTSATRPTPAQMVSGLDSSGAAAAYADNDTVSGTSLTEAATGLTASTAYYVHVMHVDSNGNYSVVRVSAQFTTAAGAFVPVTFDGTNDYLNASSITGLADGKAFTVAFKFTPGSTGIFTTVFDLGGTNRFLEVGIRSTNALRIRAENAAGTTIFQKDYSGGFNNAGGERTVLFSVNLATSVANLYVDGVDQIGTPATITNDTIDMTHTGNEIGAANATEKLNASISYFVFDDSFIDLTNSSVRNAFASPSALGSDGSGPFGFSPLVCYYSTTDVSEWNTNKGTGGNLTVNGTLT